MTQQNNKEIIEKWILISIIGFLLFLVIYIKKTPNISFNYEDFEIEYLGLNQTEIEDIDYAIWDLESPYKRLANHVIIFKNVSFLNNSDKEVVERYNEYLEGININDGDKILIIYDGNPCNLRVSLCHELIHSLLNPDTILNEEDFTYQMGEKNICYANPNCDFEDGIVSIYQKKTNFIECKNKTNQLIYNETTKQ